jgi:hypothetical protein
MTSRYAQTTREKRKAAGLCTDCGAVRARPGFVSCEECARERREGAGAVNGKTPQGRVACAAIKVAIMALASQYDPPRSPTVREIAAAVKQSVATVASHLRYLRDRGEVEWDDKLARTLRVIK